MSGSKIYFVRCRYSNAPLLLSVDLMFTSETQRDAFRLEAGRRDWVIEAIWAVSAHDLDSAVNAVLTEQRIAQCG